MENERTYTAFAGNRLVASGDLKTMVLQTKEFLDRGDAETILIFEDQTGEEIDFDFRGTPDEVLAKLSAHPLFVSREEQSAQRSGPGRPKLGVVCREVSLLPRHWEWLEKQPGGASVTLRKIVEETKKRGRGKELARMAREAAGKFMWAMAGNLPNFEEASRALYAKDTDRLGSLICDWPPDVRNHILKLVSESARLDNETPA